MKDLPSGTVTFLFTDIEGSTRIWGEHPGEMQTALAQHDAILRECVEIQRGHCIKTTGDGIHAVFETAIDAVNAAARAQRALAIAFSSPDSALPLKVRMGLHTGEAEMRGGDYYGQTLNRAARIMSAGSGGQILLSAASAELVRAQLPGGASLQDLGEHSLKGLTHPERIFQLRLPELPQDFPALESLRAFPNNLPLQLTSFIGREKELTEIKERLRGARLVTLTGSGGTGKTRLAQEAGAQGLAEFPHGVWLVELAPLTDPAQIIPAMAQVMGLQAVPYAPMDRLVTDYLRDKNTLLILDNCEHLVEACARLADDLLHQCAGLKILASSREALGIAGEAAYPTPSLAGSEAERLFVERARAVNPRFDPSDRASITQICARLDGIPLAIELAAARTRLLPPEQIARRLDDRFHLLVGGSRTALPRQQTLRALIDWSYDLLSEDEKRVLRAASVFAGGWTLEALEAVTGEADALENLEQLINKSLVAPEERGGGMRYSMLETIRQYAREKLFDAQEGSQARDRHFFYFDALSEKLYDAYRSSDAGPTVWRAEEDVENFRAALEWGQEKHVEENLRLAANYCIATGAPGLMSEGVEAAKNAVERARLLPPLPGEAGLARQKLIARALFAQGMVGMGVGDLHAVLQALQEAIDLARGIGDQQMLGYSLGMYYTASNFTGAPPDVAAAEEAMDIFRRYPMDLFGLGMATLNMARVSIARGDEAGTQMYFGKLQEIMRQTPHSFQVGLFLMGMGMDESVRGNYDKAREIFEQGEAIFKDLHHVHFQLILKSEIGHLERRTGRIEQARAVYQETLPGWQKIGNRSAIAHQLECYGFLALEEEEPRRAARLFGAAEALREKAASTMTDHERHEYDRAVVSLRAMLAEGEFDALWSEGRALSMEKAVELALK